MEAQGKFYVKDFEAISLDGVAELMSELHVAGYDVDEMEDARAVVRTSRVGSTSTLPVFVKSDNAFAEHLY